MAVAKKINGTIALEGSRLQIKADNNAQTSSVALNNVTVTVPDLSSHDEILFMNRCLKFKWVRVASEDALIARGELRLALNSIIVARYQWQKPIVTNVTWSSAGTWLNKQAIKAVDWKLVRGGIGINAPVPEPDSGVSINLNAKILNIDV